MKNKDFFYLQYNKINWKNQDKTGINSDIYSYIIDNTIKKSTADNLAIFEMGFGIGLFIKMLAASFKDSKKNLTIEGCEPSAVNYSYWEQHQPEKSSRVKIETFKKPFQDVGTETKFDFITSTYVFPAFLSEELGAIVQKIYKLLKDDGQFILVLSNEEYLKQKLRSEKDLFIETSTVVYNNKSYQEFLHYTDIPEIGKVIDYNREEAYYLDLFNSNGFKLFRKEDLDDNGFICTIYVFEKT